jgi:hypothetical protein
MSAAKVTDIEHLFRLEPSLWGGIVRFGSERQDALAGESPDAYLGEDGTEDAAPADMHRADGSLNGGRLTDRARKCLAGAGAISRGLGHALMGTGHLLAAIARDPAGVGGHVMQTFQLSSDAIIDCLAHAPGRWRALPPEAIVYNTPALTRVLAQAGHEALRLQHNYVGTEHILISLMRDTSCYAHRLCDLWGTNEHLVIENALSVCAPDAPPVIDKRTPWSPHLQIIGVSLASLYDGVSDGGWGRDSAAARAALQGLSASLAAFRRAMGELPDSASTDREVEPPSGADSQYGSLAEALKVVEREGLEATWRGRRVNPENAHLWSQVLQAQYDSLTRFAESEGWGEEQLSESHVRARGVVGPSV